MIKIKYLQMKDINIQNLFDDYLLDKKSVQQFNNDYVYKDDSRAADVKYVILNKLSEYERRLFLIYIDSGSLRQTGKVFNCSYSKIWYIIKDIREKIIDELQKL